jgi:hypothetical protein
MHQLPHRNSVIYIPRQMYCCRPYNTHTAVMMANKNVEFLNALHSRTVHTKYRTNLSLKQENRYNGTTICTIHYITVSPV